jgi:peptidoglycan/LPS O-acetylase OafA/YrhL
VAVISDPTAEMPDVAVRRALRFRPDVDGLRAIAIVLVVAYHCDLPGFSGGFIGVDVFFVISGWLITRNLLKEVDRTGRVALISFWGKRIRRLVPSLALMVVSVLVLALLVMPSIDWQSIARQARAALLYVSNIGYARQATSYFGGNVDNSLYLHTWSLGVEEQFYLVWPFVVGGACLIARRRREWLRPVLLVGFSVLGIASLALCVHQTSQGSPYAFFGLPARAWEFAAAGLLAALPMPRALREWSFLVAVVGLSLIAIADLGLDSTTPYPGLWAVLPVAGTLLVITAGEHVGTYDENPLTHGLTAGPMQWLGRVSYAWYLWHWPLILLAVHATDHSRRTVRVAAALVALGVAAVAHRLVENPIRFNPRLVASRGRTYAMGALVTVAALLATVAMGQAGATTVGHDATTGAIAAARSTRPPSSCPDSLAQGPTRIAYCVAGDATSHTTVLLAGDSHAGQWVPAFSVAAASLHLRLVWRWRGRCPAIAVPVEAVGLTVVDNACTTFQRDTQTLIGQLHPRAVVVSESSGYGRLIIVPSGPSDAASRLAYWRHTYEQYLRTLVAKRIRVGGVVDTPGVPGDPDECAAQKGAARCAIPARVAMGTDAFRQAEQAARDQVGGLPALDVNSLLCGNTSCPVKEGSLFVYDNDGHVSQQKIVTFVPQVRSYLQRLLG